MRKFIFILLLLAVVSLAKAQQYPNQPLVDSLAKWAALDQTAAGPAHEKTKNMTSQQREQYADSVFSVNEKRLKEVFTKNGFPGYSTVGKKGSFNFWLMVQHCDKDVPFQQEMLKAMEAQVVRGNADPANFAYLTDRVRINTKQKQLYGTQIAYKLDSCQAIPKPLADSLTVNERRKAIGLSSIESYLNMMSQLHFNMNKAGYESRGIHQPKLIPEPEKAGNK